MPLEVIIMEVSRTSRALALVAAALFVAAGIVLVAQRHGPQDIAAASSPDLRADTLNSAIVTGQEDVRIWHEASAQAWRDADAWRRAEAQAAAEVEARRRAPATSAHASRGSRGRTGGCGGWDDLVAKYFPAEVGKACRVLMCESGGSPGAIGPVQRDGSPRPVGLMQIKGGSTDPEANVRQAAQMRSSRGWQPWACA